MVKVMYKWMYDKMVTEYSKKPKEELIQEIISLEGIECSDRCFANECRAGATIYNINELFATLTELKEGLTKERAAKVYELIEVAENSWEYVKHGLATMNNNSRCDNALEDLKKRVACTKGANDII